MSKIPGHTATIFWLGDPECHRRELVGGKAANLSRLAASFPVPPGFSLTAAAFAATATSGDADFPHNEVAEAYQALAEQCGQPDPSVAVRSSAIDEDGVAASFAGQFESYLNIVGAKAVVQAISSCWTSANSERIRTYRQKQGLVAAAPLAVLVQQQIPADVSAVAFSANPVSESHNEIIINANWGLGESIVGGDVTPDTYVVGKSGMYIASSEIADKQHMSVHARAGTRLVNVPRLLRTRPSLNESQILELAQLALSLEQKMGWPVDVECAFQGERLLLLQCRPITALGGPQASAG